MPIAEAKETVEPTVATSNSKAKAKNARLRPMKERNENYLAERRDEEDESIDGLTESLAFVILQVPDPFAIRMGELHLANGIGSRETTAHAPVEEGLQHTQVLVGSAALDFLCPPQTLTASI